VHRSLRRPAAVALTGYLVILMAVFLGSNAFALWLVEGTEQRLLELGAPASLVGDDRVEFFYNTLALVPVSGLGSLVWPRWNWRDWTAFGFVLSFTVESVQALVLPERTATFIDIVANTLGAALGALVVLLVRWAVAGGTTSRAGAPQ
jgi:glycopeptide antibiotics resistance protein